MGTKITDTTLRDARQSLLANRASNCHPEQSEGAGVAAATPLPRFFAKFILSGSRYFAESILSARFFASLRMTMREGLRMTQREGLRTTGESPWA